MKQVVLNFGSGNLRDGCNTIVATFLVAGQQQTQCIGSLPPAPDLAAAYEAWHTLYGLRSQSQVTRIKLIKSQGQRFSEAEFRDRSEELIQELTLWLNSASFYQIDRTLRTELSRQDEIQLILEIKDPQLKRLPWQQWSLLKDYPKAEIALGTLEWHDLPNHEPRAKHVRVLAVIGEGTDIDTSVDANVLTQLPHAEVVLLRSPTQAQFTQSLWDPQGWDILCFAGHSQTISEQGYLYLNEDESLTIPEIQHALSKAIDLGLRVAIFNSCDGFGLAERLADLYLPYAIVMREPVPDSVAQLFLNQFLQSFSQNLPLHLAVREARQRLEAVEKSWPCASLLPTLWQNPTAQPLRWQALYRPVEVAKPTAHRGSLGPLLLCSLLATGLSLGVRSLGYLEGLELATYDHLVQQRPLEVPDPRVLVVEIDQADTQKYGYPIEDQTLADLVGTLQQYEPRAIGMDIHRSQPKGEGAAALMSEFQNSRNFFWVCSYRETDENYAPPEAAIGDKLVNQMGFSDLLVDGEALPSQNNRNDVVGGNLFLNAGLAVRRQLLSYTPELAPVPSACITPYSLSFQLAYEYLVQEEVSPLDVNAQQNWQFGTVEFPALPSRFGGYQSLGGQSSQILINYRANQPGQRVSLSQVLAGNIDANTIRDRIVLIGYTSPVARDSFQTPYGPMPGVWIHGHMVSQLISAVLDDRPLIWVLPHWRGFQWGDAIWVLGWCLVASILWWQLPVQQKLYRGLILVGIGIGLYGACFLIFIQGGWMPLVPTLLALVLLPGIRTGLKQIRSYSTLLKLMPSQSSSESR